MADASVFPTSAKSRDASVDSFDSDKKYVFNSKVVPVD